MYGFGSTNYALKTDQSLIDTLKKYAIEIDYIDKRLKISIPAKEKTSLLERRPLVMRLYIDPAKAELVKRGYSVNIVGKTVTAVKSAQAVRTAVSPQPAKATVYPQPVKTTVYPQPTRTAVAPQPVKKAIAPQPVRTAVTPQPVKTAVAPQPVKAIAPSQEEIPSVEVVDETSSSKKGINPVMIGIGIIAAIAAYMMYSKRKKQNQGEK